MNADHASLNGRSLPWPKEVAEFLSRNLRPDLDRPGFNDMCSSAYQMGCAALVALGQAEATPWGAVPLAKPRFPDILPRWDDVCCVVIGLALQEGRLHFRLEKNDRPTLIANRRLISRAVDGPPPPPPNIAASAGLAAAHVEWDAAAVLEALGLLAEGRWTAAAELVFCRKLPGVCAMEVTSDPRFTNAVQDAVRTVPKDVREDIKRLVTITDTDVDAATKAHIAHNQEMHARFGRKALAAPVPTPERTRSSLERRRCNELNWVFFRRWRLPDGWLGPEDAGRALSIFHDRLAIAMRRRVMLSLHPEAAFSAV